MAVFCKKSIRQAIESLKEANLVKTKEDFWNKLSQYTFQTENNTFAYKATTLKKYLENEKDFDDNKVEIIKIAALKLGAVFDLVDDSAQTFVMDASFLNLEHIIYPENRQRNRIEPDIEEKGQHSIQLRIGFKTVNFGRSDKAPVLYSTSIFVEHCQIQIMSKAQLKFRGEEGLDNPSPFRYVGKPADSSIDQWEISNISTYGSNVNGSLGEFNGCFTLADTMTALVRGDDFNFGTIKNIYAKGSAPEIDESLSDAIQMQKKVVLKRALKDAMDENYILVVRPLVDRD